MVKARTLDWNQVVDELAAMPPRRLNTFLKRLQKRRHDMALRQGYAALAKLSFDDAQDDAIWIALENEALALVDQGRIRA